MPSTAAEWKRAKRPNYNTSADRLYPYSEVPYIGEYHLLKLGLSSDGNDNFVDHVDYWGEGRIDTAAGSSGFRHSYNVNHEYQLVSNGPDEDRKIPNRIPVYNYDNCDTSSYIAGNSVVTVTLMGAPINDSCANDIARMVNNENGKVVLYGIESNSGAFANMKKALDHKRIFHCPHYELPPELQGLDLFSSHTAFLNIKELTQIIYNNITEANYDHAVDQIKQLDGYGTKDLVASLLTNKVKNFMSFSYKLWTSDGKDIINTYFPKSFPPIFNEDIVRIRNQEYHQAMKLDANVDSYGDRLALGDSDINADSARWRTRPIWENNAVTFKINNDSYNMFLKLDVNEDPYHDRLVWGSSNSNEERHKFYIVPLFNEKGVEYHIINFQYNQGLKLDINTNHEGDRGVWGSAEDVENSGEKRFRWAFEKW